LGPVVPAPLEAILNGRELSTKAGHAFLLLSADASGWPRVAILSAGEVVVMGDGELRLALWPDSASTSNLSRTRRATLAAAVPPRMYYLRLECTDGKELHVGDRRLTAYRSRVVEALEDRVPYAELTTPISFRLAAPDSTLTSWEAVVAALRA
jgi:hypothetical protein